MMALTEHRGEQEKWGSHSTKSNTNIRKLQQNFASEMYKISNLTISTPNYFVLSRALWKVSLSVWTLYGAHRGGGSNIPIASGCSV